MAFRSALGSFTMMRVTNRPIRPNPLMPNPNFVCVCADEELCADSAEEAEEAKEANFLLLLGDKEERGFVSKAWVVWIYRHDTSAHTHTNDATMDLI
jgi:hypothetical protein